MADPKGDPCFAAKSAETFSKPVITLIYTDGGAELVREKERSHEMPGFALPAYYEIRDWSFGEVYENDLVHRLRKKRLPFKPGVEEKLQVKTLVLWAVEGPSVSISEDQW